MPGMEKNIDISESQEVGFKSAGFKKIEVLNPDSVEECKNFWNHLFSEIIKKNRYDDAVIKNDGMPFNTEQDKIVFSNLKEMERQLDTGYKEIKEQKPPNSPNLAKWFEKGGTLEIEKKDEKQVWVYSNPEGVKVSYVDGYPVFPPETKHPCINDMDIGSFTGDRNEDKRLYIEKMEEEYGLTEIPKGYALHHDAENGKMQLIKEEYHKEFTHAGGHSKFKEGE